MADKTDLTTHLESIAQYLTFTVTSTADTVDVAVSIVPDGQAALDRMLQFPLDTVRKTEQGKEPLQKGERR